MMLERPTPAQLRRLLTRTDHLIDAAGEDILLSLQKAVRRYATMAQATIENAIQLRALGLQSKDIPKIADIVSIGDQLGRALLDAGLDDVATEFRTQMDRVRDEALKEFSAYGLPRSLAGIDVASLDAFAAYKEASFLDLADRRLVTPLADAVIQSVVGQKSIGEIRDEIWGLMQSEGITTAAGEPFTDYQMETLVDDSMRRHARLTKQERAASLDMNIVWFTGPDDSKTSAQCEFMLTHAEHGAPGMWLVDEFTKDNINNLMSENGVEAELAENPIVAGGHWNCRHTIQYVTKGFAAEQGFESDDAADDEEVEAAAEELQ